MAKLKGLSSFPNIPHRFAIRYRQYLLNRNYAITTINTRMGNLNYLFSHYGIRQMHRLLSHSYTYVQNAVDHIKNTNPAKGTMSMDVSAFKLAWESIHGIDIVRR